MSIKRSAAGESDDGAEARTKRRWQGDGNEAPRQGEEEELLGYTYNSDWYDVSLAQVSAVSDSSATALSSDANLICYGMVTRINCQQLYSGRIEPLLALLDEDAGDPDIQLGFQVCASRLVLGLGEIPDLAYLNSKATYAFLEILQLPGVSVTVSVARQHLVDTVQDQKGKSPKGYLVVDANIYGPWSYLDNVGNTLSDQGIFLQQPSKTEAGLPHVNPHLMVFDDISNVDIWFLEQATASEDDTDWTAILDELSLDRSGDLDTMFPPVLTLKTALKRHQSEALDFMCQREMGLALGENKQYWQLERSKDGTPVHTVTGDESLQPQPEPLGGILADEMGLGKTLTCIALISSSLERASYFIDSTRKNMIREGQSDRAPQRATLIIVPSTRSLKITVYHGHSKVEDCNEFSNFDVVLTTYGTVTTEWRKRKRTLLHDVKWFRVILDEAHFIRCRRTKQFQAVTMLDTAHHWCLTGTPICNQIDDLGALLDFCRVPVLGDEKTFQRHVAKVARQSTTRGAAVLKAILSPLCLRRTKAVINLSPPRVIEEPIYLSAAEKTQYQAIMESYRDRLEEVVSGHRDKSTRDTMLCVILRLRILCNQGTYLAPEVVGKDSVLDADEAFTLLEQKDEAHCVTCLTEISSISFLSQCEEAEQPQTAILGTCGHAVCMVCYHYTRAESGKAYEYACPSCDLRAEPRQLSDVEPRALSRYGTCKHSSKLEVLLNNLVSSQQKSIVFSVWKRTLDIVSSLCTARKITHLRVDGTTPQARRMEILEQFSSDPAVTTLLMTIGTGALGLNLTAASCIHILEPQWNPATESQAIGRSVRMGQENKTTVIYYIVKDTVEEHVQSYKRRKTQLAVAGFGQGKASEPTDFKRLDAESLLSHI
ncbi:hypothetical protein LTR22_021396 [Elasticomyces elasticus]|nr:hypothetical protein LTR22_021396 [Elasticomyces elasticus]KAK4909122.1 hypothetical protein LTR49_022093 [Elasticomyces elasticus]KAK5749260.1 hypothetical protein LTS12_020702 [Elasticomyces elasticus]